jgi:hypothetical protein
MPRLRPLEGRDAGIVTRAVQGIFRLALGRELNPYKLQAYAPRAVLSSFLSNTLMTTGRWALGGDFRHMVRVRVAALNGCPF